MPFKIKGLKLRSIDLCREGANPDSHILLTKSMEGGQSGNTNKDNNSKGGENMKLEDILKELPEDQKKYIKDLDEKLNKSLEDSEKLEEKVSELEKSKEDDVTAEKDNDDIKEEILKKADDKTKSYIEKLEKQWKEANEDKSNIRKELSEVQTTLKKAKFVELAKSEYKDMPEKSDKFGEMLMKMETNLDEETFTEVKELFKKVNNVLKESSIFDEQGSNMGSGEGDSNEQEIKEGIAKIKKSNPELSKEQAATKYLEQNPDKYETFNDMKGV